MPNALDFDLSEKFRTPVVRDLAWVLTAPGILAHTHASFHDRTVDEDALRARVGARADLLAALDKDPIPLDAYLEGIMQYRRLGRYFERLLEFGLRFVLNVERLETNLAVRGSTRTLGELDIVFRDQPGQRPQHWEATVKFYINTATNIFDAQDLRRFCGTVVEDRLDIKLKRLFDQQLPMSERPEAQTLLAERDLLHPESRALVKGLFFYPSNVDWRHYPCPPELAPHHPRGWWTTAGRMEVPQTTPHSFWIRLGLFRWLARHEGPIDRSLLMNRTQLEDFVKSYFDVPATADSLRRRELTIAEVTIDDARSSPDHVWASELTRGHIVHAGWPALAESVFAQHG